MNILHPCPSQHSLCLPPLIHTQFLFHKWDRGSVHPEPALEEQRWSHFFSGDPPCISLERVLHQDLPTKLHLWLQNKAVMHTRYLKSSQVLLLGGETSHFLQWVLRGHRPHSPFLNRTGKSNGNMQALQKQLQRKKKMPEGPLWEALLAPQSFGQVLCSVEPTCATSFWRCDNNSWQQRKCPCGGKWLTAATHKVQG